ncbi:helix-turn-helix domain-containing protein [Actinospongicola halichondriae]|uniref:helix-turn-helix domain-containing protein n=1 Tax=Actinospongicola halichondriae TaxID=3236844 RepID=UPI003D3D16D4
METVRPLTHDPPSALLTIEDIATSTRYSVWTVRSWVRSGLLPAYKIGGGAIRVLADDLETFIRSHPAHGSDPDGDALAGRSP